MKTSLKNGLRILFFSRLSQKKGIRRESYVRAEEMEPRPSSDRDGRIYRLAVPVLNKKNKKRLSFHVVVGADMAKNVQKNVLHVQSCCFAN